MDEKLKKFLWERKMSLLNSERLAKGKAKDAIGNQLQVVDLIFQYLSSKQQETDMENLKLSLDDQLISLDDLKPRQRENKVAKAVIEYVKTIPEGKARPINAPGISVRTVLTQVYALKEKGLIPEEIMAISRNGGKEGYIGRAAKSSNGDKTGKEVANQKAKGK